jgi:hypothetical protein
MKTISLLLALKLFPIFFLFLLLSGCRPSWRCVDCGDIDRRERIVKAEYDAAK